MGVGYKLPLNYNVIKTTLKSTNHEAEKNNNAASFKFWHKIIQTIRKERGRKGMIFW